MTSVNHFSPLALVVPCVPLVSTMIHFGMLIWGQRETLQLVLGSDGS